MWLHLEIGLWRMNRVNKVIKENSSPIGLVSLYEDKGRLGHKHPEERPCEDTVRRGPSTSQWDFRRNPPANTLILNFQPTKIMRNISVVPATPKTEVLLRLLNGRPSKLIQFGKCYYGRFSIFSIISTQVLQLIFPLFR